MNAALASKLVLLGAVATGSLGCADESVAPAPQKHHVAGDAIPFDNGPDGRIEGAKISVFEHPEMTVITGADGHFQFDGFEAGSEVTLVLECCVRDARRGHRRGARDRGGQ